MKGIPSLIRKKITQGSRSYCPFCGEKNVSGTKHGRIQRARGGKNYSEFSEYETKYVQDSDD